MGQKCGGFPSTTPLVPFGSEFGDRVWRGILREHFTWHCPKWFAGFAVLGDFRKGGSRWWRSPIFANAKIAVLERLEDREFVRVVTHHAGQF
jgi:hypothetical protein